MSTLYLDRKGVTINARQNRLELRDGDRPRTIPLNLIERMVLHHNTQLDSQTLLALSQNQVSLIVLGRRGEVSQLLGVPHNRATIRLLQYNYFQKIDIRERVAKETVVARMGGQQKLLQRALQRRPKLSHLLTQGIRQIGVPLQKLQQESENSTPLQQLRGIEGGAAANYFRAYTKLFAPSLQFTSRKRRPPPDPVNAILSLGYTLLHSDAVKATWGAGLDPWIGYYHDTNYGRESLASDIIESHRHRVDELVWEMFREQTLTKEHFGKQQNASWLNKSGRKIFYHAWEQKAPAIRRLMRLQCYQLGHWISAQK